ncbi:IMP4-like U3 small nucleolar ribonucleoprotein [Cryptosporidium ubiquitum]|uniref:IMP4-like U3 small nucleolar ribonucleoprotein n=1 Tax=Cryptosporidium ubiquitum TaxID=857276 RepID=A0A1J4MDW0_9CRYT|nr:IMP4-like U3 small nucleolar ribonucleoprotein [Cryptosporidium ubiquitum]OII72416.1 IMP4-like U3 small nucleolar ribonucleoprotein [Cryptosporidium ubiquitum]
MSKKEKKQISNNNTGSTKAKSKSSKNAKDKVDKETELANKEINLKSIKNKIKRVELANQLKREKKLEKSKRRRENREKEQRGEEVVKGTPRTIENTREIDETFVHDPLNDSELHKEMENDEFSDYFSKKRSPKLLITTNNRASKHMYNFLKEIVSIIPNCDFYKRNGFNIKDIIKEVNEKGTEDNYTDILIFTEHPIKKIPWGLYICHLPIGPTSYFRIRSVKLAQDMKGSAFSTTHNPEVILNNFDTRIGYRIGRQLASLFPFNPDFAGRRVIAFHNQRDFIFFRHYRYIFRKKRTPNTKNAEEQQDQAINSAGLQEIGPRFTLKLMWIQEGTFNTKKGIYEYLWRPDLQVNRKVFFL